MSWSVIIWGMWAGRWLAPANRGARYLRDATSATRRRSADGGPDERPRELARAPPAAQRYFHTTTYAITAHILSEKLSLSAV